MKTASVKISTDFSRMLYTVHLFTEDMVEFMEFVEEIPSPAELWKLAEGYGSKTLEIPEEFVKLPKELFKAVWDEMRRYCPEISAA